MVSIARRFIIASFAISISFLNLTTYAAQGNPGGGKGHGVGHGHGQSMGHGHGNHGIGYGNMTHTKSVKTENLANKSNKIKNFTASDRTTITNYFNKNPISAGTLPPGIAMNLARGKPLPPGIAKQYLPSDLITMLPSRPGYEYLLVGNDAVLVNSTTGIVADIISNVLK